MKDFRAFLLRGNVVDLAVGIIIGAAFSSVVTALVKDLITPLIAALLGKPHFDQLDFTVNGSHFLFGDFINAVFSFVLMAAVVFFFIVRPINELTTRFRHEPPPDPSMRKCPYCLSDIPTLSTRCSHCTAEVERGTLVESAQPA